MSHWDAVVVGAGHNGLVAANLLADAGWSVLVLEEAEVPGGAVRTAEFVAPGFRSDVFSAVHPFGYVSPALRRLRLHQWGLEWSRSPLALAHVFPDGRTVALSDDVAATAASVATFAPGDAERWRDLYRRWRRVRDPVLDALLTPFPPVRAGARLGLAAGPAGTLRIARLGVTSAWRLADEELDGEGGRALLLGNALHADVSPFAAGSGVLGWLLCMVGQDIGFPVPRGGSARIVDALVARLRFRGGELRCGTTVASVTVRDGRAIGVIDAGGRSYAATRAVLADVDAPRLYRDLVGVEHLPAQLVADLDRFEWDHALLKVNWALDTPIPWRAEDARRAGTIHLGVDRVGFAEHSHAIATGRMPDHPFVLMGQMTTADPSRSPAGTETAWAYTHVPPELARDDAALDAQVKRLEGAIQEQAPGFLDRVRARVVQTPLGLQGGDPNLRLGATNAGTAALSQQLLFRPVPGLGRPETVIDGMFLAGASAHPGGGVHGAPGANAARAALARARLTTRVPAWALQRATAYLARTGWRQS